MTQEGKGGDSYAIDFVVGRTRDARREPYELESLEVLQSVAGNRSIVTALEHRHRSDALDALRFICAIWVLFAHLIPWTDFVGKSAAPGALKWIASILGQVFQPAAETHPAVLTFIVLSGYCVHRNGFRRDRFQGLITSYAIRRVFRIYPVYVLATLAGLLAFAISAAEDPNLTRLLSGTEGLSSALIVEKFIGISAWFPPLNQATYQGNAPLHTVMVEIWLYVAYPVVFLSFLKWGEQRTWGILATIWLVGALLCSVSSGLNNWWHNGSLFGFLIYWWIGARSVGRPLSLQTDRIAIISCIIWLLLTVLLMTHMTTSLFLVEARKVCFAILAGGAIARMDEAKLAVPRLGVWLGKAGYSLYAFHAPVLYSLLIAGFAWWSVAFAALASGVLLYVTYERPLTEVGRKISRRTEPQAAPKSAGSSA